MAVRIELPSQPSGSTEEQLVKLYSYLYQMAKTMNLNLEEIGDTTLSDSELELMNLLTVNKQTSQTDETVPPGYNYKEHQTLKSLIIKTADFVKTAVDAYRLTLFGETEANSEFGTYLQKKGVKVDVTPDGVKQTYSFSEVVKGMKNFEINSKNYIKTGLLRTEDSLPIYGVAIGKDVVTFAEDGTETYNDGNKVAELTADELSFFQNGTIVAKYAGTKTSFYSGGNEVMYIQNGKIYAAEDLIISSENKVQIGNCIFNKKGMIINVDDSTELIFGNEDLDQNKTGTKIQADEGLIVTYRYKEGPWPGAQIKQKEFRIIDTYSSEYYWAGTVGGTTGTARMTGVDEIGWSGYDNGIKHIFGQKIHPGFLIPIQLGNQQGSAGFIGTSDQHWGDAYIDDVFYDNLYQQSSREKKKNIEPIPDPGERLDQLEPVSFIYKNDKSERRHQGLIYEDTVEIMPEICSRQGEPKTISYIELVPILLKEIQGLRRRIKALEEKED